MVSQDPKELVQKLIDLLNGGRLSELEEVLHSPRRRLVPEDARAMRRFFTRLRSSLPDYEVVEEVVISDGDRVAVVAAISGTSSGKVLGIPPTSGRVVFRTMNMWRVVGGRLAEHRGVIDLLGLLIQLGAIPGAKAHAEPVGKVRVGEGEPGEALAVARQFHESISAGRPPEEAAALLSPQYVDHAPFDFEGKDPGAGGRVRAISLVRSAFPDLKRTVDLQVAEGDLVASAVTDTGTHTGSFLNASPTGKAVQVRGINLERVCEGRIVESWHVEDLAALARQLGVI